MSPEASERALIKKLVQQGVEFIEEKSTSTTMFFRCKRGKGFTIPRPLTGFGWSYDQQEFIAATLEYLDLEFWPLDYN